MKKKVKPFQVMNVLIMLFLIGITLYPMYYVVVASISDPILQILPGALFVDAGRSIRWRDCSENPPSNKSLSIGLDHPALPDHRNPAPGGADQLKAYVVSEKCFLIQAEVCAEAHDIYHVSFSGGLIPCFRYRIQGFAIPWGQPSLMR